MSRPNTDPEVTLCSLCSRIDFDIFRLPTAGQLRRLSAGQDVYGPHPFHRRDNLPVTWQLGSIKRVQENAKCCSLCGIICHLIHDIQQMGGHLPPEMSCRAAVNQRGTFKPGNTANISPILLERMGVKQPHELYFKFSSIAIHFMDNYPNSRTHWQRTISAVNWLHVCDVDRQHTSALFGDQDLSDDQLLFARRTILPRPHIEMLSGWMGECMSKHKTRCGPTLVNRDRSKINVFRLIDVKTRAIVRFSDDALGAGICITDHRYIALSYVWGPPGSQRLLLKRNNWHVLKEPGALHAGAVSRTINDAISLTDMLGFRYLWVDALCILQDDDDTNDKSTHLAFMGQIYRHAELTIVAAAGKNAEAGLSGVNRVRKVSQHSVKVKASTPNLPGLHLLSAPDIRPLWGTHYLHNSEWTTRGWTLQEKTISRRTLIFTETQVYWSCREANWAEETLSETSLARGLLFDFGTSSGFLELDSHDDSEKTWNQIRAQMTEYSTRRLTSQGDAYDAFSGVLQEFTRITGEPFLWAVPAARFELGLCWTRHVQIRNGGTDGSPLTRRTNLSTLPDTTLKCPVPFPSWSWLGWIGSIEMRFTNLYMETGMEKNISCYVLRNSPLRVVEVASIKNDNTETDEASAPLLESIFSEYPQLTRDELAKIPENQLIVFWSDVAVFQVAGPTQEKNETWHDAEFFYFDIHSIQETRERDRDGGKAQVTTTSCGKTDWCSPGDENDAICRAGQGQFEFVLLATNNAPGSKPQKIALQISRKASMEWVANRICIASISEEAWYKAQPTRRLVILG